MSADPTPSRRPAAIVIDICQRTGLYSITARSEAVEIQTDDKAEAWAVAEMMAATLGIDIDDRTMPASGDA